MRRHLTHLSLVLAAAFLVAACGDDSGRGLPSVPRGAVPDAAPTVGDEETVTLAGDGCIRAGELALVFVEGQAELTDVGTERRLEVRWTTDEGGGALASVAVDAAPATPVGHPVDPEDWAEAPPDGCDGPYLLVTGFDLATD